jgi:uncharacterized SAM-binding protein YcdF (DUF218 family)
VIRFLARIAALLLVAYGAGFGIYLSTLPGPAGDEHTDAIVVLTGKGGGRLERGFELMGRARAERMLISGVQRTVRPQDLIAAYRVEPRLFACCIALDRESSDTRSNADEIARWLARRNYRSVRLVTNDFHMPRARLELRRRLDADIAIVVDAVPAAVDYRRSFEEYNKLLFAWAGGLIGI